MNEQRIITKYVLGFMFSPNMERVILIEKQKPEWQKGFLNGVGGKIELLETPENAMVREFYEETGVKTNVENWSNVGCLRGLDFEVYLFMSESILSFLAETKESEKVGLYDVSDLHNLKTIHNLQCIIPMMLEPKFASIHIQYY